MLEFSLTPWGCHTAPAACSPTVTFRVPARAAQATGVLPGGLEETASTLHRASDHGNNAMETSRMGRQSLPWAQLQIIAPLLGSCLTTNCMSQLPSSCTSCLQIRDSSAQNHSHAALGLTLASDGSKRPLSQPCQGSEELLSAPRDRR